MVVTLEDAKLRLDRLFENADFDLGNFRLRGPGLSQAEFETVENKLGCSLPLSYRETAGRINLGHLTLGSIQFGSGRRSKAEEVIAQNTEDAWWGVGERPADFIAIGRGDPYVALLRLHDGAIFAFDGEQHWSTAKVVAANLSLFLRGLASAYFLRYEGIARQSDAETLNSEVGGTDLNFWRLAMA